MPAREKDSYDDILHMPRPVSKKHPPMPISARAAQFLPFAALQGYDDAIAEAARAVKQKTELDEYALAELSGKLSLLKSHLSERPVLTITYYKPDDRKPGGSYVTITGTVRRVLDTERTLVLHGGHVIAMDDIARIEGALFMEAEGASD